MTTTLTRLDEFFTYRGFTSPDIPLLQPAEPFLDTAGERMRGQIFMTRDMGGKHLCLRPEFTIPVCLAHLNGSEPHGKYAYSGVVFRQDKSEVVEFNQAGVEIIGGDSSAASDVKCITIALEALAHCGEHELQVVFGDQTIFETLLSALDLPHAWQARLGRAFGDGNKLESDLRLMADSDGWALADIDGPLREALNNSDTVLVEQLIEEKMQQGNLPASGGRACSDIAQRLLVKAELAYSLLSDEQRRIVGDFLNIDVALDRASETLRQFAHQSGVNMDEAIDRFEKRAQLLLENTNASYVWRAGFGRSLDYYTGIVFEIRPNNSETPVCGGGRYDRLMGMLGAGGDTPAIGFAIWPDRLPNRLGGATS